MAETDDKTKKKNKNVEKALLYIAVLLGYDFASFEELAKDKDALETATVKLHTNKSLLDKIQADSPISNIELNKEMAKTAIDDNQHLMRVTTVGDGKVCEMCGKWQGKIISIDGADADYPSLDDYIKSGALHPNCRCSLQELTTKEIPRKPPNPRAHNSNVDLNDIVFN